MHMHQRETAIAAAIESQIESAPQRGSVAEDSASILTLWMTGLSGSGKSTLAEHARDSLVCQGKKVFVLDGDVIRAGLCRDLGFSLADRAENIRRVAEVARLLNLAGVSVLVALISPLSGERQRARQIIGENSFREIHISTSLEVCMQRDVKGLYAKARAGLIAEFTGVSSPYEVPDAPHLRIDTHCTGIEDATQQLLQLFHKC